MSFTYLHGKIHDTVFTHTNLPLTDKLSNVFISSTDMAKYLIHIQIQLTII